MEAYRIARNLYELQRLTVQMGEAIAEDRSREAFPDMCQAVTNQAVTSQAVTSQADQAVTS